MATFRALTSATRLLTAVVLAGCLFACASEESRSTWDDPLGAGPLTSELAVDQDSLLRSAGTSVERFAHADAVWRALVVYDAVDDESVDKAIVVALAEGLAERQFAVDVVAAAEYVGLLSDYDLFVFHGLTERITDGFDVVDAIESREDLDWMPVVAVASGQAPSSERLRELKTAIAETGAILVESAGFQHPELNHDGPEEPPHGYASLTREAHRLGECIAGGLLE